MRYASIICFTWAISRRNTPVTLLQLILKARNHSTISRASPLGNRKLPMKRLVICCDGTWQDSDGGAKDVPTNVTRIARALESVTTKDPKHIPQIMYYQSGVGTGSVFNKLLGGGTGFGLSEHVREGYGFLAHNYAPGDTIHLFGFSRGAYTARSIAGLVCRIGLLTKAGMDSFFEVFNDYTERKFRDPKNVEKLHKEKGELIIPNVKVQTIGCWDTVGSLGIPSLGVPIIGSWISGGEQEKYGFHDTDLSHSIEHAFHALALDEERGPFTPTMWSLPTNSTTKLKQVWFPGVHTNIGGGYANQEIADISLAWMIQQMEPFLEFSDSYLARIIRNKETSKDEWALGEIYNSAKGYMRIVGGYVRTPGSYGHGTEEKIHPSVRIRTEKRPTWSNFAPSGCNALKGWTFNKETKSWEKGEMKIVEEELGEIEKKLAGEAVRRDLIGDRPA